MRPADLRRRPSELVRPARRPALPAAQVADFGLSTLLAVNAGHGPSNGSGSGSASSADVSATHISATTPAGSLSHMSPGARARTRATGVLGFRLRELEMLAPGPQGATTWLVPGPSMPATHVGVLCVPQSCFFSVTWGGPRMCEWGDWSGSARTACVHGSLLRPRATAYSVASRYEGAVL
jgi:hypothetical protein